MLQTDSPAGTESPWKLLDFYRTEDELRLDFADIKYDYAQSDMCYVVHGPVSSGLPGHLQI